MFTNVSADSLVISVSVVEAELVTAKTVAKARVDAELVFTLISIKKTQNVVSTIRLIAVNQIISN